MEFSGKCLLHYPTAKKDGKKISFSSLRTGTGVNKPAQDIKYHVISLCQGLKLEM